MQKNRSKKFRRLVAVAVLLIGCLAIASFGQTPKRIKFARHAVSAKVSGTLSGYKSEQRFRIRVRDGQTLRTEQIGDGHHITIYIEDPHGNDVGDSDASCNNRREITPTEAGDYLIRVVECQKADPWRGRFRFRVTVR